MNRRQSYFCARDASISEAQTEDINCIEVILRIKNSANRELFEVDGNNYIHKDQKKNAHQYSFSNIYDRDTAQQELFNDIVKPKFLHFINGNNYSLLAYGISGSGKTYTIFGNDTAPGIIPRSLEYLVRTVPFISTVPEWYPKVNKQTKRLSYAEGMGHVNFRNRTISNLKNVKYYKEMYASIRRNIQLETIAVVEDQSVKCDLWVTFYEIYNENIFDLLNTESLKPKLKIFTVDGHASIKGLTAIHVSSDIEAYLLLQIGLQKANYASTGMNNHSSRSHCVFSITMVQYLNNSPPIVSSFNLYDLAGSEKQKKSNNVGERLAESNSINKSLLTLNKCIKIATVKQNKSNRHVPVRDSKLTQLLQGGLLGKEPLTMIVTLNPVKDCLSDTENVLNFSAIAQKVLLKHEMENLKSQILASSSSSINFTEGEILDELDELDEILEQNDLTIDELESIKLHVSEHFFQLASERETEYMNHKSKLIKKREDLSKSLQEYNIQEEDLDYEIENLQSQLNNLGIALDDLQIEEEIITLSDSSSCLTISDDEETTAESEIVFDNETQVDDLKSIDKSDNEELCMSDAGCDEKKINITDHGRNKSNFNGKENNGERSMNSLVGDLSDNGERSMNSLVGDLSYNGERSMNSLVGDLSAYGESSMNSLVGDCERSLLSADNETTAESKIVFDNERQVDELKSIDKSDNEQLCMSNASCDDEGINITDDGRNRNNFNDIEGNKANLSDNDKSPMNNLVGEISLLCVDEGWSGFNVEESKLVNNLHDELIIDSSDDEERSMNHSNEERSHVSVDDRRSSDFNYKRIDDNITS